MKVSSATQLNQKMSFGNMDIQKLNSKQDYSPTKFYN